MNLFADYNGMTDKEKKEYELSLKYLYISLGFGVLFYYLMPYILIGFCGNIGQNLYGYSFISIYPVFIFVASFLHARKFSFKILIPAALSILFIPTSFIFYGNIGLVPFAFMFFIMGLFGELSGYLLLRRSKSKRQPWGLNKLVKQAEDTKDSDKKNKDKKNKDSKKSDKKTNTKKK